MPGTNSFYPYGESSTNILNNSEYQTDSERSTGAQSGAIARSKMYNKQARQAAAGAYAVGALVAKSGKNADDSSAATLAANFQASVNYQAAHFVASAVSVSGTTATATVAELATTAAADLPALFALSLVLDQALPAGASIAIASSLPDVTLSWPIYVGSEALDSDTITGGAITLLIDTVGAKAFFKAGGGSKIPNDLPPLNPNFTLERSEDGTKIIARADKLLASSETAMLAGGVWVLKSSLPHAPDDGTVKEWSRADLITTGKPYDGLYLGDVTPSDAVNETLLWLPENNSGSVKLVPFIVLSVDYLSGVAVTKKYAWQSSQFDSTRNKYIYDGSVLDSLISTTYLNSVLDSSIVEQLLEVDLPSNGGTIKRKAFQLSATELGLASTGWTQEGTAFPYFGSSERRMLRTEAGTAATQWTRSRWPGESYPAFVNNSGTISGNQATSSYMARPSFVLPKDFKIQQRPDGSYTVWSDLGLQTLADIEPSSDVSAVYANITEGGKIVPTIFLNKEYSGTEGALLLRNDIYTNAAMSSATYQNSGADNTCTTWATAVVDEPYRAKMLDIEVKYYDVAKASVQTVPSKRKAFILGSQGLNVPGADTWPKYETTSPYFASDNRRKAPSGNVYWNRDKYSGNDAFSAYYYVSSTGSAGYENGANSRGIRPACVLGLDTPIRALADGTYDLVPEDPALAQAASTLAESGEEEPPLEWEVAWDADTPAYVRQYTYNQKGQYQTMLQGAVASTEDAPIPTYSEVLSENTWAQIAEAVANNDPIVDSWQIGDTKDEVVAGETLTFTIVGKDHDDKSDGTGKAKLTFGMTQLMNNTRQMNSSNTNAGSFAGSALYAYLRDTILPGMPEELRAAIKPVNKQTSSGSGSSAIRNDSMSLWLFSEVEIFGTTTYSFGGEGFQYSYFATAANRIKRLFNGMGEVSVWWERSPRSDYSIHFCCVATSGAAHYHRASYSYGVCFGFCI